jgi:hypothetical protein
MFEVGGFLELSVSKDDDLTYDFKCGHYFLKTILTSKSLKNFKNFFLHFVGPKILAQCPSLLKCKTHCSGGIVWRDATTKNLQLLPQLLIMPKKMY